MAPTKERPTYHSVPFRADVLRAFRQSFPVPGIAGKVYLVLLQEAIANQRIQDLLKQMEADWDSSARGFIGLGDRNNYDQFLELMGTDSEKSVIWNSLLLKAFLEHSWVRKAVGDRMFNV